MRGILPLSSPLISTPEDKSDTQKGKEDPHSYEELVWKSTEVDTLVCGNVFWP